MPVQLTNFDKMWNAYPSPNGEPEQVKQTVGGQVVADWITNTCVIRMSRSFNYAGHPIPQDHSGLKTLVGGDKLQYAFRVSEFHPYLLETYGPPTLSHTYAAPGGQAPPEFKGRKGVICFVVTVWNDATGHMDLWNGERCIHHAYFDVAASVHLWEVPGHGGGAKVPPPSPNTLGASVGRGGKNEQADVLAVQALLRSRGVDPGAIDGVCGPVTVAAIQKFQGRFLHTPDGRVDPNGRTWHELSGLY